MASLLSWRSTPFFGVPYRKDGKVKQSGEYAKIYMIAALWFDNPITFISSSLSVGILLWRTGWASTTPIFSCAGCKGWRVVKAIVHSESATLFPYILHYCLIFEGQDAGLDPSLRPLPNNSLSHQLLDIALHQPRPNTSVIRVPEKV